MQSVVFVTVVVVISCCRLDIVPLCVTEMKMKMTSLAMVRKVLTIEICCCILCGFLPL